MYSGGPTLRSHLTTLALIPGPPFSLKTVLSKISIATSQRPRSVLISPTHTAYMIPSTKCMSSHPVKSLGCFAVHLLLSSCVNPLYLDQSVLKPVYSNVRKGVGSKNWISAARVSHCAMSQKRRLLTSKCNRGNNWQRVPHFGDATNSGPSRQELAMVGIDM